MADMTGHIERDSDTDSSVVPATLGPRARDAFPEAQRVNRRPSPPQRAAADNKGCAWPREPRGPSASSASGILGRAILNLPAFQNEDTIHDTNEGVDEVTLLCLSLCDLSFHDDGDDGSSSERGVATPSTSSQGDVTTHDKRARCASNSERRATRLHSTNEATMDSSDVDLGDTASQAGSALRPSPRRIPGSFDDAEISPTKENFDTSFPLPDVRKPRDSDTQPTMILRPENIPPLEPPAAPKEAESSFADSRVMVEGNKHSDSMVEQAVRDHLQDIESSFSAHVETLPTHDAAGRDDTFVFDSPIKKSVPTATKQDAKTDTDSAESETPDNTPPAQAAAQQPLPTPRLPEIKEESEADLGNATSSLEGFSSSPTAAAAARTISRAISPASAAQVDSVREDSSADVSQADVQQADASQPPLSRSASLAESNGPSLRHSVSDASLRGTAFDAGSTPGAALRVGRRPKYLKSRNASQRSSISSFNNSDDVESDVTVGLGTDYALQSGGAIPTLGMSRSVSNFLSRSISMGSMASGIGDYGDSSGRGLDSLQTPDEEGRGPLGSSREDLLQTPRAKNDPPPAPTDTVIARHVRNVQVPESLAQEYRVRGGLTTPIQRKVSDFSTISGLTSATAARTITGAGTAGGAGRNMTLKEQSSTIERLSKENFDLKLKVMFLSDRLDKLSEEGIKEMISENVELKTALAVLQRENKGYRRRMKELERQVKDQDEHPPRDEEKDIDEERDQLDAEREEELVYLRERVEEYVTEIERLRGDSLQREAEKRRMTDLIRSLGEKTGDSVVGRQEEVDVWKDLLEQETARREQADDDNQKLQQEIFRLRQNASIVPGQTPGGGLHHTTNIYNITKKARGGNESPTRPITPGHLLESGANGGSSVAASSTLVEEMRKESEQLRHENAELRREVSAQTSMLTSRNREKERLYQEIEDLKLAQRRGGPAPSTIDSLLERSASRAGINERPISRASGGARPLSQAGMTQVMADAERDDLEGKVAAMRDRNNELKMQNQDLQREIDSCMEDFEAAVEGKKQAEELVANLNEDLEAATADLMALQAERDEALQEHAALENEFEILRAEAQEEITNLERDLDERAEENQRLLTEVADRTENFDALQEEMRKMSDGIIRLEDEQDNKVRRIQQLETDLAEANKELEDLEGKLVEANDKAQRLGVQQESSQGEIAFLREEQEGDKMRIGDLEAAVAGAEQSLRDERERIRELESRLATERQQREIVATREKEEVQQFVNELNREASAAKDEARRLRKSLGAREVEATEWKERLMELESNLRAALGDLNGTRSSLLKSIAKLQRDLENTVRELEATKSSLVEKDRIIKQRDALLESHSVETRKLAEALDKEVTAHRAVRTQLDTFQKTHNHVARTAASNDARIAELESAKASDKKKLAVLEMHMKEQLGERNNLLLLLWTRLSALCGKDWAHDNSLINGRALPSVEVVATQLPGFTKNLLEAVKTLEALVHGFTSHAKGLEKALWKEYRSLETHLDQRVKRLDRIEATVRNGIASGTLTRDSSGAAQEMHSRLQRLDEAYRQLKVENATLRAAQDVRSRAAAYAASAGSGGSEQNLVAGMGIAPGGSPSPSIPTGPSARGKDQRSRLPRSESGNNVRGGSSRTSTMVTRTNSARDVNLAQVEEYVHTQQYNPNPASPRPQSQVGDGGAGVGGAGDDLDITNLPRDGDGNLTKPAGETDRSWMQRLRDMEIRLRKEREGRMSDRTEASRRILQAENENTALRERVEREKVRRAMGLGSSSEGMGEGRTESRAGSVISPTGTRDGGSEAGGVKRR